MRSPAFFVVRRCAKVYTPTNAVITNNSTAAVSDYDRKNEFNVEKFLSTKLKVQPEEAYDVYEIAVEETEDS